MMMGLSAVAPQHALPFFSWIRKHEPRAWSAMVARVPALRSIFVPGALAKSPTLKGFGQDDTAADTTPSTDWGSVINSALKVGSGILGVVQNQQLFKANLSRAQQGLPPVPVAPTAAGMAPRGAPVAYAPGFFQTGAAKWVIGGGALVLLGFVMMRRR